MKKLIMLFVLISTMLFASTREMRLDEEICGFIKQNREAIQKKTGYMTEPVCWTQANWVTPTSQNKYPIYLEPNTIYVIYGMTTGEDMEEYTKGPNIQGCVDLSGRQESDGKNEVCSKIGNQFMFYFQVKKSGKYYYYVRGKTKSRGLHVSYITQLYRHPSEIRQRQEFYDTKWVREQYQSGNFK